METLTQEITITEKVYKILGYTQDVNECDCCGRKDLKGTVCMEDSEGGVCYFGVVCAAHMSKRTSKEIVTEYKETIKQNRKKATIEFRSSPEYKACWEKIEELNNQHLYGVERMEILRPFIAAERNAMLRALNNNNLPSTMYIS